LSFDAHGTKQFVALCVAIIAFVFFIAAAGTSDWEHITVYGHTVTAGAFGSCGPPGCVRYYPDCSERGDLCDLAACPDIPQPYCNQYRAGCKGSWFWRSCVRPVPPS